jgi:hypothetical protein
MLTAQFVPRRSHIQVLTMPKVALLQSWDWNPAQPFGLLDLGKEYHGRVGNIHGSYSGRPWFKLWLSFLLSWAGVSLCALVFPGKCRHSTYSEAKITFSYTLQLTVRQ